MYVFEFLMCENVDAVREKVDPYFVSICNNFFSSKTCCFAVSDMFLKEKKTKKHAV